MKLRTNFSYLFHDFDGNSHETSGNLTERRCRHVGSRRGEGDEYLF